jgi:hypothetical protein
VLVHNPNAVKPLLSHFTIALTLAQFFVCFVDSGAFMGLLGCQTWLLGKGGCYCRTQNQNTPETQKGPSHHHDKDTTS